MTFFQTLKDEKSSRYFYDERSIQVFRGVVFFWRIILWKWLLNFPSLRMQRIYHSTFIQVIIMGTIKSVSWFKTQKYSELIILSRWHLIPSSTRKPTEFYIKIRTNRHELCAWISTKKFGQFCRKLWISVHLGKLSHLHLICSSYERVKTTTVLEWPQIMQLGVVNYRKKGIKIEPV